MRTFCAKEFDFRDLQTSFQWRCRLFYLALATLFGAVTSAAALPQPVVAIHNSELTRALESIPATGTTPTGSGTTGYQWWPSAWHYFVMPESLKEALRSDGTLFAEVSDADIAAGHLLNSDGSPRYPILISLASEAVDNGEIAPLRNYVAAGGTLLLGSSALTRLPDGRARADFALASEMGLHKATPNLQNWYLNQIFTKVGDHRLVSHIPSGSLFWQMPLSADEVPWGTALDHGQNGPHYAWAVQAGDAQVIAMGSAGPLLTVKQYGSGRIIYHGVMQPLIAHGGMDVGMYAYGIFRNAIQWAFETANVPIIKLSPWRYPYDAAFTVRHDFENITNLIGSIESSAQVENFLGVKGDYYFCTGELRENMGNDPGVIASLQRAVVNDGAMISSHNGGLKNPVDLTLQPDDYFYWHWGPDEVLDVTPAGYSSGLQYATVSIENSFQDIEGWLAGTGQNRRYWVSPFFNSTRDDSYSLLEGLGVVTVGEQKLSPFPHWTLSTQTAGKRFAHVTMPVSEWFVTTTTVQEVEEHSPETLHALVDAYYNMGTLINLYGHKLSTETIVTDYITYSLSKPRIWAANSSAIYDWWMARSSVLLTGLVSTAGSTSIARATVSGAVDPETAIEVAIPKWSSGVGSVSQVLLNGVAADLSSYRVFSDGVRVRVGTNVTTVEVDYNPTVIRPQAQDDAFTMTVNSTLNVAAPGVLGNDGAGISAVLVSAPGHGSLQFNANGSFTYTPQPGFVGTDFFTYKGNDGSIDSNVAKVSVAVSPAGALYFDDFTRPSDPTVVSPWTVAQGAWMIKGGVIQGGYAQGLEASAYIATNWTDYAVQGDIQFGAGLYTGGLGGRVNPANGAHYAAWIFPESTPGNPAALRLIKFSDWWDYDYMQSVSIPAVGSGWHTLKLTFQGSQIAVALDGSSLINMVDNGIGGVGAYPSGGISADLWLGTTVSSLSLSNVFVSSVGSSPVAPLANNDSYSVVSGTPLSVTAPGVLANDSAASGKTLTAALVSGPAHGTLSLQPDGSFTYTSATGFSGTDSFTYKANDGSLDSGPATVIIAVNAPSVLPVANSDSYSVVSGTPLSVAAPGVLANDSAASGKTLTAVLVSGPANGTLALQPDGSFIYTPAAEFSGTDGFTYKANDGSVDSNPTTVSLAVNPVGALFDDNFARSTDPGPLSPWTAVQGNWTVTGGTLQGSNSDFYGNAYVSGPWSNYVVQCQIKLAAGLYGGGLGGRLNSGNGAHYAAWIYPESTPGGEGRLRLVKFTDWWDFATIQQVDIPGVGTGWHSLSLAFQGNQISVLLDGSSLITMTDTGSAGVGPYASGGISADLWAGTVSLANVVVSSVGSSPVAPVANSDSYSIVSDTQLSVAAPGVLANDSASSGKTLTAVLVSGPANGMLALQSDGSFTYTSAAGFSGTDSFTYKANDGSVDSGPATVSLAVTSVGALFNDNFARSTDPGPLSPWTVVQGNWTVTGGTLQGSNSDFYGNTYVSGPWSNYVVQCQIKLAAGLYGGGLGGRLNSGNGAHYAAWIYPESTPGGEGRLRLVKFTDWWDFATMQQVDIPGVGTGWHLLSLAFQGNQISVSLDGSSLITMTDTGSAGVGPYASGGISADLWAGTVSLANVLVSDH